MMTIDLTPTQRKIVGSGITVFALAVIVVIVYWVFVGIGRFLATFSNVLLPLATAGILALVLKPYYRWLLKKLGNRRILAVCCVFGSILVPLLIFGLFFGNILWREAGDLIASLPSLFGRLKAGVVKHWPNIGPAIEQNKAVLASSVKEVVMSAWSAGSSTIAALSGMFGWFVLPVYLVFLVMAPSARVSDVEKVLPFLKEKTREDVVYLCEQFVEIMVTFFRGQLVIALLQGLMMAIGFSLVGLRFGFVLGLLLGFLNIVPYLGSMIGLAICLPLALFQLDGGWLTLVLVLLVFGVVQTVEGYVLTPRIMGDRTGLHPLVIIVAILFWGTALDGVLGMILAIPLTAFLVVFWRLAKQKYIHEWI